jgi:hypothetical protein
MHIDIELTENGAQIVREGECNIPTIIPSLINDYVDIICGYDQAM